MKKWIIAIVVSLFLVLFFKISIPIGVMNILLDAIIIVLIVKNEKLKKTVERYKQRDEEIKQQTIKSINETKTFKEERDNQNVE
jgi:ABC-type transport system involved in cytochrome bd biosynthesis fused ATPase/permease subunit